MEILYQSNCNRIHGSITNSFFLDPLLDKRNKKKEHQRQIIEVYQHWVNDEFQLGIDFNRFNPQHAHITFIGQFLPVGPEQQRRFLTNQEMALLHLDCEDYKEILDRYNEILGLQNNFNIEMNTFIQNNSQNIQRFERLSFTIDIDIRTRFTNQINQINGSIREFRNLLRPVIDNDLLGECPRERKLSLVGKVKSWLSRRWRSVSK